jgi:hypothetical protein
MRIDTRVNPIGIQTETLSTTSFLTPLTPSHSLPRLQGRIRVGMGEGRGEGLFTVCHARYPEDQGFCFGGRE